MAINLDNVKAITHNNKDVIKIEDSNGNTIWTKPPVINNLILSSRSYNPLDLTTYSTSPYGSFNMSGRYVWSDGTHLYGQPYPGGNTDKYEIDYINKTTSLKTWSGLLTDVRAEYIWTDGTNIYHSHAGSNYILNKTTGEWETLTFGEGNVLTDGFDGGDVFHIGNNTYYQSDSNHVYQFNSTTKVWVYVKNQSGSSWSINSRCYWSPDGINFYYSDQTNSRHYILNTSDFSFSFLFYSGLANSNYLAGTRIYKINNEIYAFSANSATGGSTYMYKLDQTSIGSNTLVWTDVSSLLSSGLSSVSQALTLFEDNVGDARLTLAHHPRVGDFN